MSDLDKQSATPLPSRGYCTVHDSLAAGSEVCEAAILAAYRVGANPYDKIRCKLVVGRLVDREDIDYEAMRLQFDENYYAVEGDPGRFMDLLHSMFDAAIGNTAE